jgi:hypothetical protein
MFAVMQAIRAACLRARKSGAGAFDSEALVVDGLGSAARAASNDDLFLSGRLGDATRATLARVHARR